MESNLDCLKGAYQEMAKEHNLPEFDLLNEDFAIEKIADSETDFLIREVRKCISEKFSVYLRLIEGFLHPVNSPMFVYNLVKNFSIKDKENLVSIYKKLAKKEVDLIELDLFFDEKKESTFIIDSFKLWAGIKEELLNLIKSINKNWDNKLETNGKNYFG